MTTRMLEIGVGDNPRIDLKYEEYYAVDSSGEALDITQRKLEEMGRKVHRAGRSYPGGDYNTYLQVIKMGYEGIPCDDSMFDFILADQFLEHLPRHDVLVDSWDKVHNINPVIQCLNDLWRVAKHGAKLQFNVPKWDSAEMWQDPTHCNPVPPQFWIYFDPADVWQLKESYGIKASMTLDSVGDGGWYHVFTLTAIKI